MGIALLALNLRPGIIVISAVLPDLQHDLSMSSATAGVLGAAPPLAFGVFGALAPRAAKAVGLERLVWLCLVLIALTGAARVLSQDAVLFVALSTVAYAGMGVGNVLLPALVKKYFPHAIARVSSAYILTVSIGATLPAFSAVPLARLGGWPLALTVWAAVALLAAGPWIAVSRRNASDGTSAELLLSGSSHLPVGALLRSRLAWGLATIFGTNSLNAYAMFAWLPSILVDAGMSEASAGVHLGLFASVALPIALVVPWLTVRLRNSLPMVVFFATAWGVGYAGLLVAPTSATALWVIALGLGPGTFPLVLTLVGLRTASHEAAAALAGFTQGIGYVIAALGPFVVGLLNDLQDGWSGALTFLLSGLVLQVLAGVVVARAKNLEDELRPPPRGALEPVSECAGDS